MKTILTDEERREVHRQWMLGSGDNMTGTSLIEAAEVAVLAKLAQQETFIVTKYDPLSWGDGLWLEGKDKAHFFPYGTALYAAPMPAPDLQAELTSALESENELQSIINDICSAIPNYDWNGGAVGRIKQAFEELDAAKIELRQLSEELAAVTKQRDEAYTKGRAEMQNEIVAKLGTYEANKCAQIAASIPV